MLGNWEIHEGQWWRERLEQWLDEPRRGWPLDAWIIQRDVLDAAEYAETWLRDAGVVPERDRDAFDAAYEAYLSDFDARGVEGVGFGIITLRRAEGGAHDAPARGARGSNLPVPLGPHIARVDRRPRLVGGSQRRRGACRALDVVAGDVTRETYGQADAAGPGAHPDAPRWGLRAVLSRRTPRSRALWARATAS